MHSSPFPVLLYMQPFCFLYMTVVLLSAPQARCLSALAWWLFSRSAPTYRKTVPKQTSWSVWWWRLECFLFSTLSQHPQSSAVTSTSSLTGGSSEPAPRTHTWHQRCFESSCHCLLASHRACGSGQQKPSTPGSDAPPACSGTAGQAEEARGHQARAGSNRGKAMRLWCEAKRQEWTSNCFWLTCRHSLCQKKGLERAVKRWAMWHSSAAFSWKPLDVMASWKLAERLEACLPLL